MDIIGTTSIARVNDPGTLRFIIGSFLSRYPANTRKTYTYHLKSWLAYCEDHGLDPMQAQRGHIETYSRHLVEERGLTVSTQAQHVKVICGLYKFAHLDEFIAHDPGRHVRRPKVEFVSTTNGLTKEEAIEVLRVAPLRGPVATALMTLLILNGLRIGETLAANIEHLGKVGETRTIFLPHRKGGKSGTLGLAAMTTKALDRVIGGRTSGPIFLGKDGQRLKVAAARRIVARVAKKAGVTKRITPHSCRHTMVTLALDAGVPVRDIMDSSGHGNPIMISYYDRNRGVVERNATFALAKLFEPPAPPVRAVDRDGFPLDMYPGAVERDGTRDRDSAPLVA